MSVHELTIGNPLLVEILKKSTCQNKHCLVICQKLITAFTLDYVINVHQKHRLLLKRYLIKDTNLRQV